MQPPLCPPATHTPSKNGPGRASREGKAFQQKAELLEKLESASKKKLLLWHHPVTDPQTTWTVWSQLHQPPRLSVDWWLVFQTPQSRDPGCRRCALKGKASMTVNKNQKTLLLLPSAHCQIIRPSLINGTKATAEQNHGKFLQQANPPQLFFPDFQCLDADEDGQQHYAVPFIFSGHWKTISSYFY